MQSNGMSIEYKQLDEQVDSRDRSEEEFNEQTNERYEDDSESSSVDEPLDPDSSSDIRNISIKQVGVSLDWVNTVSSKCI